MTSVASKHSNLSFPRFPLVRALMAVAAMSCWTNRAWAADGDAQDTAAIALLGELRSEDEDVRYETIMKIAKTGDLRMESLLEDYRIGNLYIHDGKIVVGGEIREDADLNQIVPLFHVESREPILGENGEPMLVPTSALGGLSPGRKERQLVSKARHLLRLSAKDPMIRLAGVKRCGDTTDLVEALDRLDELAANDPLSKIRYVARESALLLRLSNPDRIPEGRVKADLIAELGEISSLRSLPTLETIARGIAESEGERSAEDWKNLAACEGAIELIAEHQRFVRLFENVYQGISLSSVLIFMALGLAITFGLMGVINMAHGELMMIGAYATYEMQLMAVRLIEWGAIPESAYDWYFVAALPASFLAAAFVGYVMEVLVIRHLYRRPIESLLATWGIGLILIQAVRIHYGDNIGVNAPSWARGGVEIMQDVTLPYGRTFIVCLCAACIGGIYLLMRKTRTGLLMRTTMQNRDMANALGVNTQKIDRLTFALGSGIAGIAGCAWTLIGGVTPDMGQKNFIVDSFLIVVTGGVGEMAGVICAGLGIGITTKVIEPMEIWQTPIGAIWAKVIVLSLIVTFIQFKPAGLFAPKGRLADV